MIATTTSSISYVGNASTSTPYPIPFPLAWDSAIVAIATDEEEAETVLDPGDYTFTPTTDINGRITGGNVTTDPAIPETSTILLKRVTPRTQTLNLEGGAKTPSEALESALDKLTMIAQEQDRDMAEIAP